MIDKPGPLAPDYPGQYGLKAAIAVTGPSPHPLLEQALSTAGWFKLVNFSSCHPYKKDGTEPPLGLWFKHNQDYPVPAEQPAGTQAARIAELEKQLKEALAK